MNPIVNKLLEEAANVLAKQIMTLPAVEHISVIDVLYQESGTRTVTGTFLLVHATESLVKIYEDLARRTDYNRAARKLLMKWSTDEDELAWLKENCIELFETQHLQGAPMRYTHWFGQLSDIKLIIVPAVGMQIDDLFLYEITELWKDENVRPVIDTVCKIYQSAYLAPQGAHDITPHPTSRPGEGRIRSFCPRLQRFED